MLSVSEIVAKTEAMFDLFNHHFYNGELTRPAITVSPDGGSGAYGWCSVYEIWQASGEAYREINICAEYIDRPIGEVAATMLHEMLYLYKDHVRGRNFAESLAGNGTRKTRKAKSEDTPMPEKIAVGLQSALEQAEAEGQPVAEITEAAAQGAEIAAELNGQELTITAHEPENMEAAFNVIGERRRALVEAVKAFADAPAI